MANAKLELEAGDDVLLLETGFALLLEGALETYYLYIVGKHIKYQDIDRVERVPVASGLMVTHDGMVVSNEGNVVYS